MKKLNVDDLKKSCRICLQICCKRGTRNIFRDNIDTMLMEMLPIQLTQDDRLPTIICNSCLMTVKKFHNLREEFMRNDKRIWELFNSTRNELEIRPDIKQLDDDAPLISYVERIKMECEDVPKRKTESNHSQTLEDLPDQCDRSEKEDLTNDSEDSARMLDVRTCTCKICRISYTRFRELRYHMINKHAMSASDPLLTTKFALTGLFKCLDKSCGIVSKQFTGFAIHMRSKHRGQFRKDHTCAFCFQKFFLADHMRLHVTTNHLRGLELDERLIKCPKCEEKFRDVHELARHCNDAHAYGKMMLLGSLCSYIIAQYDGETCELCGRKYLNILAHKRESHKEELPPMKQCGFCSRVFNSREDRYKHECRDNDVIPAIKCAFCSRAFESRTDRRKHECRECRPLFKCKFCPMQFKQLNERRNHVTRAHKTYKICDKCGCLYGHKHKCKRDVTRVNARKVREPSELACHLCERKMKCVDSLRAHIKVMHGEKAGVMCAVCKKMVKAVYLNRHMKYHLTRERHACSICHKVFRQKCNLNNHLLVHANVRPYACRYCNQSFRHPHVRKNHEMTHTGEQPYECTFCQRRFIQRSALLSHMKSHGGPLTFACDVCSQTFVLQMDLDGHMAKYHAKMDDEDVAVVKNEVS